VLSPISQEAELLDTFSTVPVAPSPPLPPSLVPWPPPVPIPITSSRPLDSQNLIRAQKRSRHHSRRGALLALSPIVLPEFVYKIFHYLSFTATVWLSRHTPYHSKHTTSSGIRVLFLGICMPTILSLSGPERAPCWNFAGRECTSS